MRFFSKLISYQSLNVFANNVTNLDITQNSLLVRLELSINNLTELDVSKNLQLESLSFLGNALQNIDLTHNTKLKVLIIAGPQNTLTELNVTNCKALEQLTLGYLKIASLDISQNKKLKKIALNVLDNLKKVCVWQFPLPDSITVTTDLTPETFTVCDILVVDSIKLSQPNIDSVYTLLCGKWYEVMNCNGFTGRCDSVYSSVVNSLDRVAGTDSIIWKTLQNDTLIHTSKYLLSFSPSYVYQSNRWMFTQTYPHGSIALSIKDLITVSSNELIVSADANDGGGIVYSRQKSITGISFQSNNSALLFSPNPTIFSFSIKGIENIESVTILDINGKLLQRKIYKNDDVFPLTDYPNGIYLVQVLSKNKIYEGKVVKY